MEWVANILVGVVALIHVYILVLEMFLWTAPRTLKAFGQSLAQAQASRVMAANQGLYNGFLAAGLIWGLVHPDAGIGRQIELFFLTCVFVAGVYGGLTAKRSILFVQALPAAIALLAVWLA